MAQSNKPRIHIVIFAHTPPDRFHWSITTGPKAEVDEAKGKMYHVINKLNEQSGVEEWH